MPKVPRIQKNQEETKKKLKAAEAQIIEHPLHPPRNWQCPQSPRRRSSSMTTQESSGTRSTNQKWPTNPGPMPKPQEKVDYDAPSESKQPTKKSKPPASQTILTPVRNTGDQWKGRLWDSGESSSAESTNQCEELTKQMSYWPAQSNHCYDPPAEPEQFLNPPSYPRTFYRSA